MPVSIAVDHQRRLVSVFAEQEVGLKDIEGFLDILFTDSAMAYRKFIDSRNARAVYTAADVTQLATRLNRYSLVDRRGAVAMVVHPEHRDVLERLLQLGRPQRPARTFLDPIAATLWLNEQPEV
jgi:hypothetical protein